MKSELWQRAKQIFLDAAEQPLEKRESFLNAACGDDDDLRAGVDELLELEQRADQFLFTKNEEDVTVSVKTSPDADRFGEARADSVLPQRVGSVRLLRPIGRGGMGEVWLGRDELLDRKVAVKFLLNAKPTHDDPDFKSLLDGARTAAAVRHANLTTIHHAGIAADRPYLVLEYIDGPTLAQLLRSVGPLELSSALTIIEAVGQAVGELHEHRIIHRDIKPSNVLLDREGRVFVTDFGLACQRRVREMGTPVAQIAGTPRYMAPEMFEQTVSVRSDVYALGVMTYEMLTGTVPFRGTFQEIHEQQLNSALPVASLRERGYGDVLIDVLERATHKSAMYRYKSAAQFLRALQDARLAAGDASTAQVDLAALVGRVVHTREIDKKSTTRGSSYYEHLTSRANELRSEREQFKTDSAAPFEPAAAPESVDPAPPTTVETLQVDVPCVTCTYNLRGLPKTCDACPECGEALNESLYCDRLMFADRALLQRIRKGLIVTEVGLGSLLIWLISMMLLRRSGDFPLLLGGGCVVSTVFAMGILVARPARGRPYLIVASAALTLTVLNWVTTAAAVRGMMAATLPAAWMRPLLPWSFALTVIALIVAMTVFLRWLRALLLRVPNARLAKKAGQCAWQLPVFAVLCPVTLTMLSNLSEAQEVWGIRVMLAVARVVPILLLFAVLAGVWNVLRQGRRAVGAALGHQTDFEELYLEDFPDHRPGVSPAVCTLHDAIFDDGRSSPAASLGAAPILCVKCGYSLLGLEADSRCPECGTPLSSSARGDLLSAADPAWLRRIHRGQLVLYVGCVALAAIPLLMVVLMSISVNLPSFLPALPLATFFDAGMIVLGLGGAAAVLIGIVGVTSLDPRLSLTEQPIALRRLTRGAAAAALAVLATAKLMAFSIPSISSLSAVAAVSKSALGWTGIVLLAMTAVCFSYYLAHLAERIPDAPLADKTRLTAKRFVGFLAVFLGAELIAALRGLDLSALAGNQSRIWMLFEIAGSLATVCALFGVVRMMVRWRTFQKALKRCLLDAREAACVQGKPDSGRSG